MRTVATVANGCCLPVGRVEAQIAAFIDGVDVLVNGVHSLQNLARDALEFAQFAWLLGTIVLQIVGTLVGLHTAACRQCNAVHVREFAQSRVAIEIGRAVRGESYERQRGSREEGRKG